MTLHAISIIAPFKTLKLAFKTNMTGNLVELHQIVSSEHIM